MPRYIEEEKWVKFISLYKTKQYSIREAAKEAGISEKSARAFLAGKGTSSGNKFKPMLDELSIPEVLRYDQLSADARDAYDNFGYFRERYFGRIPSPWQEEAADIVLEGLATRDREFYVINVPPGSGKTTLFCHDIAAWLTVRDRAIRGLNGQKTEAKAKLSNRRLMRTFERRTPVQADPQLLELGQALDAKATLMHDFGRFKPLIPDMWRLESFFVAQEDNESIVDKEPTWTAFGMDGSSLGYRLKVIFWDDLVDKTTIGMESALKQQEWYTDEAETRLDPGGALFLIGQRLSSRDLYRFCLDLKTGDPDDFDIPDNVQISDPELDPRPTKYKHIKYKAHYEDRCTGNHKRDEVKAWPDGCLLEPYRLPWRDLATIMRNDRTKFMTVYQQEDADEADVLVPPIMINGGRGTDGIEYPGCLDKDRGICELPPGLTRPLISVVTTDPSPTKYWAIQWWIYQPSSGQCFLMDLHREKMQAPDILDFNAQTGRYVGLMEEWAQRAKKLGFPIKYWVVEENAAQKFLYQYNHAQTWLRQWSIRLIPHQTNKNKADPELGVETLRSDYEFGRMRLPGKRGSEPTVLKLTYELTHYPDAFTDDQVMANWFLRYNLKKLTNPSNNFITQSRPSYIEDFDLRKVAL